MSLVQRYIPYIEKSAQTTAKDIRLIHDSEVVRNLKDYYQNESGYSQDSKDLSDYLALWLRIAKVSKYSLLGVALLSVIGATVSSGLSRATLAGIGLVGVGLSKSQSRVESQSERFLKTLSAINAAQSAAALTRLWEPTRSPQSSPVQTTAELESGEPWQPTFFNWALLENNPDRYPHLGIVGATGDGKTTAIEFLTRLSNSPVISIDPHYCPGNFAHAAAVHAQGRNYGEWEESSAYPLSRLFEGELDYCSVLKSLELEMDNRYKLYEKGEKNFQRLEIILDEFNIFLSINPKCLECYLSLLREARKVGIRLIFSLQGDSAKDMKLVGQTTARNCLKWLRLGEFAKRHAKKQSEEIYNFVTSQDYPMMFENQLAKLN
jgi:hypothetical protein